MAEPLRLWEIWTSDDGEAWEAVTDAGSEPHQYSDWFIIGREAEHWAARFAFVQVRVAA